MKGKDLVGSTIVEWEYANFFTVEKNGKKYEVYFDETSGTCTIEETK